MGRPYNKTKPKRPQERPHCLPNGRSTRPCLGFEDADEELQRQMAAEALEKMRQNGFVARNGWNKKPANHFCMKLFWSIKMYISKVHFKNELSSGGLLFAAFCNWGQLTSFWKVFLSIWVKPFAPWKSGSEVDKSMFLVGNDTLLWRKTFKIAVLLPSSILTSRGSTGKFVAQRVGQEIGGRSANVAWQRYDMWVWRKCHAGAFEHMIHPDSSRFIQNCWVLGFIFFWG